MLVLLNNQLVMVEMATLARMRLSEILRIPEIHCQAQWALTSLKKPTLEKMICAAFAQAEQLRMGYDADRLLVHETDLVVASACVVGKHGNDMRDIVHVWDTFYRPRLEHALDLVSLESTGG